MRSTTDPAKIGEDQFGEFITVTAFEEAKNGHTNFLQRLAQPLIIFRLERFLRERIARVGVEAGRNTDQLRLEVFEVFESAVEDVSGPPFAVLAVEQGS